MIEIEKLRRQGKSKTNDVSQGGPECDYSDAGRRTNLSKKMAEWGFINIGAEYEDQKVDGDEFMDPAAATQYRILSARGIFPSIGQS